MANTQSLVSGVAGRYALALFDLAAEEKALEEVEGGLNAFGSMMSESEALTRLVRSPVFSADDQDSAFGAILEKAEIGGLVANFLRLAARNRRAFAIPDMIKAFATLAADHRGEATAEVASAEAMSDGQIDALKKALKEKVGKDVKIDATVDPSLIGGLVVKIGSRMIDTSLRTKLNSLKLAMKEIG